MGRAAYDTRLEHFRKTNHLSVTRWADAAELPRRTFRRARMGGDLHLSTVRAIVRAANQLLDRVVEPQELFDLNEDVPPVMAILRRDQPKHIKARQCRYSTKLDRVLRGEGIVPTDFGSHAGIARQTLLRYRKGLDEPSLFTLARIIRTLREMTGKPYKAKYLYDLGNAA